MELSCALVPEIRKIYSIKRKKKKKKKGSMSRTKASYFLLRLFFQDNRKNGKTVITEVDSLN